MKEFDGKKVIIMSCSDCNTRCKHCLASDCYNRGKKLVLKKI